MLYHTATWIPDINAGDSLDDDGEAAERESKTPAEPIYTPA